MTQTRLIQLAMAYMQAILEAIEEGHSEGTPLGPLYAAVCGVMTLDTFNTMIQVLQETGKIKVSHHVARRIREEGA